MSEVPFFTVDSFSSVPFSGNPAGVCLDTTEYGMKSDKMQMIGAEINLSETAFIQKLSPQDDFKQSSRFRLRWFTPTSEVPMCGHATLAAAAALFKCVGNASPQLVFETLSGELYAKLVGDLVGLDLPLNPPRKMTVSDFKELIKLTVGEHTADVVDVVYSATPYETLIIRLPDTMDRLTFERMKPSIDQFMSCPSPLPLKAVIITVKGQQGKEGEYDYLLRFFAPWFGVNEDPVTGSAQTMLAPYWAEQLGKKELSSRQCSARGGDLQLVVRDDGRLDELGPATVVMRGTINV